LERILKPEDKAENQMNTVFYVKKGGMDGTEFILQTIIPLPFLTWQGKK